MILIKNLLTWQYLEFNGHVVICKPFGKVPTAHINGWLHRFPWQQLMFVVETQDEDAHE